MSKIISFKYKKYKVYFHLMTNTMMVSLHKKDSPNYNAREFKLCETWDRVYSFDEPNKKYFIGKAKTIIKKYKNEKMWEDLNYE